MLIDSHTHCRYSPDSKSDPEDNILAAIDRNIQVLAFTDHVDRVDNALDYVFDFDAYIKELNDLRERYKDKIDILIGCEMGLNPDMNRVIEPALADDRFDFFIGSMHTLDNQDVASTIRRMTGDFLDYYLHYYEEMFNAVESTKGFHVLGHMDYVDRYLTDKSMIPKFVRYRDIVAAVLESVIQKNIVVEYNTGGFFRGLPYGNPKDDILKLYRDLGGERICLSSDAHFPAHIGRGFSEAREHLKALGFQHLTYFKNKQPIEVPLK